MKIFLSIILNVMMILLISCDSIKIKTYHNEQYNFSIDLPEDWEIKEPDDPHGLMVTLSEPVSQSNQKKESSEIKVMVFDSWDIASNDLDRLVGAYSKDATIDSVLSVSNFNGNLGKGRLMHCTVQDFEKRYIEDRFLFIENSLLILLYARCEESDYVNQSLTFKDIAESMKFRQSQYW